MAQCKVESAHVEEAVSKAALNLVKREHMLRVVVAQIVCCIKLKVSALAVDLRNFPLNCLDSIFLSVGFFPFQPLRHLLAILCLLANGNLKSEGD